MTTTTLDGSTTPWFIAPDSTTAAGDGDSLLVLGTIDNNGTIALNGSSVSSSGSLTAADIASLAVASPTAWLEDGGTVTLTGASASEIFGAAAGDTLENVDNTIVGSGGIGMASATSLGPGDTAYPVALVNGPAGTIDSTADGTGGPDIGMLIQADTAAPMVVNAGLIEGTGTAAMLIDAGTIDQSGGGELLANGAGTALVLEAPDPAGDVDVIGGTLAANGGGGIYGSIGTLDGSETTVTITQGTSLNISPTLLGTVENDGTISLSNGLLLTLAGGTVTLAGDGTVEMTSTIFPYIGAFLGADDAATTLVNLGNTITGNGMIGDGDVTDTVYGTLDAAVAVGLTNGAGGMIGGGITQIYSGTLSDVNDGLIATTGTLAVTAGTLDTSAGTLLASGAGATLSIAADLIANSVTSTGGGVVAVDDGSMLTAPGGTFAVTAGSTFATSGAVTLAAATVDTLGMFDNGAALTLTEPATTLIGSGAFVDAESLSANGAATLVNADATVSGGGEIGGASLSLTNEAAGVISGGLVDTDGTVRNAGLMQSGAGALTFGGTRAQTIDNAGGTLLANGGVVTINGGVVTGGLIAANAGGTIQIGSVLYLDGPTLDGVSIAAGTTLFDAVEEFDPVTYYAPVAMTLTGTVTFAGTILDGNPGAATIGGVTNAELLAGTGEIQGAVTNSGTLLAQGGLLQVSGNVSGTGSIALGFGATFETAGTLAQTVDFRGDADATLRLDAGGDALGPFANLGLGDTIDFGATVSTFDMLGGSTLEVVLSGGTTLDIGVTDLVAGGSFAIGAPTELVVQCFAEGTRIATGAGEMAVERLAVGDTVRTAAGRLAPVRWVGWRRVACTQHPRPASVWPVRVRAGAFGPGLPARDLVLSPDHALFLAGALIPVRCLIDGDAIARERRASVTYFHVELDRHDVLLAEGLPCESFLDTGTRDNFANGGGATRLHPDFCARLWDAEACAPLSVAGPALAAARARLARRAA